VRQLQNVCERAVVLSRGDALDVADFLLHLEIDTRSPRSTAPAAAAADRTVAAMERQLILRTLDDTRANRTEAARRLGISVRTLRNKLNEYRGMGVQVDALLESAAGDADQAPRRRSH
jgi:two-component system response regulator FlrC